MRVMLTNYFGEVAPIKFSKVKAVLNADSLSEAPFKEKNDIHSLAVDAAHLKITGEKATQFGGCLEVQG